MANSLYTKIKRNNSLFRFRYSRCHLAALQVMRKPIENTEKHQSRAPEPGFGLYQNSFSFGGLIPFIRM